MLDLATIVAVAVVVYAMANLLHEGVGHGGACVAVGGVPHSISAIYFQCDDEGLSGARSRMVSAGGTIVNLIAGAAFLLLGRMARRAPPALRLFLWLSMTVNLLQGTGYLLFSGVANVGDWAAVVRGFEPHALWRVLLALLGLLSYMGVVWLALAELGRFIGGSDPERERAAKRLTLIPYLAGGALYVAAGLLNPISMKLVLISAVAASFGGASGLFWMGDVLKLHQVPKDERVPLFELRRSWAWIAAGAAVATLFIGWLGPGVRLR